MAQLGPLLYTAFLTAWAATRVCRMARTARAVALASASSADHDAPPSAAQSLYTIALAEGSFCAIRERRLTRAQAWRCTRRRSSCMRCVRGEECIQPTHPSFRRRPWASSCGAVERASHPGRDAHDTQLRKDRTALDARVAVPGPARVRYRSRSARCTRLTPTRIDICSPPSACVVPSRRGRADMA